MTKVRRDQAGSGQRGHRGFGGKATLGAVRGHQPAPSNKVLLPELCFLF